MNEGLRRKYIVVKADTGEDVPDCFVLRPAKDKAAIKAILAYANATENKTLAADLFLWMERLKQEFETGGPAMETDYISREAAINDVKNLVDTMSVCVSMDECNGMRSMKERALTALERIPAADVRPVVRARWEWKNTDALASFAWTCSACGQRKVFKTNFCPNCGAYMRPDTTDN